MIGGWSPRTLTAARLAGAFLAGALRAVRFFGAGPRARRSESSSAARSSVSVSIASSLRSEALVSPSVTYGPKRPSFTTIGLPETGSLPSCFSGGAASRCPRRCFGCAKIATASSRVTVNSCSSDSMLRKSEPFLTYGP